MSHSHRRVGLHVAHGQPVAKILILSGYPDEFSPRQRGLCGWPEALDDLVCSDGSALIALRLVQKALHDVLTVPLTSNINILVETLTVALEQFPL